MFLFFLCVGWKCLNSCPQLRLKFIDVWKGSRLHYLERLQRMRIIIRNCVDDIGPVAITQMYNLLSCCFSKLCSNLSIFLLFSFITAANSEKEESKINISLRFKLFFACDFHIFHWTVRDRSYLTTTTTWNVHVVRDGLPNYQCYCSHLTTMTKLCTVIVVDRTHVWKRTVHNIAKSWYMGPQKPSCLIPIQYCTYVFQDPHLHTTKWSSNRDL